MNNAQHSNEKESGPFCACKVFHSINMYTHTRARARSSQAQAPSKLNDTFSLSLPHSLSFPQKVRTNTFIVFSITKYRCADCIEIILIRNSPVQKLYRNRLFTLKNDVIELNEHKRASADARTHHR